MSDESFASSLEEILEEDSDAVVIRGLTYATSLKKKGAPELKNKLIRGEEEAIDAFIRAPLKGKYANIAMVSPYGAGKTEILTHGFKVFGIENVGYVPATPDLKPATIVGSYQAMTKIKEASEA